ncbi:MAG: AMP-binding protein [Candidatus Omnitrophica bacterium]|nr:AMP-binding protein [Candidatus Omnitrophota bacterium]
MSDTLVSLFSHAEESFHDRAAVREFRGEVWHTYSYAEVSDRVRRIAAWLDEQKLRKGEKVALVLENRPEWGYIYFAVACAQGVCVPIDPDLSAEEIGNLVADSEAKILFCSGALYEKKVNSAGGRVRVVTLDARPSGCTGFDEVQDTQPLGTLPEVSPEDIAVLIYTSGTTGQPKGVLLSHRNLSVNFLSVRDLGICRPDDVFLALLPLYHTYACMVTLLVPFFLGAATVYFPVTFHPEVLTRVLREGGVTIFVGVPQLFSVLHTKIFERINRVPRFLRPAAALFARHKVKKTFGSRLRMWVSGGARLNEEIARDFSSLGYEFIEGYGLTETSPVVTFNPPGKVKFGSVGTPLPRVEVRIHDPGPDGVGEVCIRGPNVMVGYYRRQDLTQKTIKDGWLYSGDLGRRDQEGYLFLTGRKKHVIVLSSGKNIYPEELEEFYAQSPFIKEICVLAKGGAGTEEKVLFAVIVPDVARFREDHESNIENKIRWELEQFGTRLPGYQRVKGFTLTTEELPRTSLRKIKRYEVREKYLAGGKEKRDVSPPQESVEDDPEIQDKKTAKKIIQFLRDTLDQPVSLSSHLEIDLGVDSLGRVEIGTGLESLLQRKLDERLVYEPATVRDLIVKMTGGGGTRRVDRQKTQWEQILREPPPPSLRKKIAIPTPRGNRIFMQASRVCVRALFNVLWSLGARGREHIPEHGPYLLCANHASYLDGFAVFGALRTQDAPHVFFLGYRDIFELPAFRWGIRLAHLIPIDTRVRLMASMKAVAYVLRHEKNVCIFPSGRRSVSGEVQEFKKGVAVLMRELDVPAVPVRIRGAHEAWPRERKFPRGGKITVIFGAPVRWQELIEEEAKESDDRDVRIAAALRQRVQELA